MANIYHDSDADLSFLQGKTIAVIGYGNQGQAQALNLRDSGLNVVIGTLKDDSWERAKEEKFEVYPMAEAAQLGQVIMMLIPDEVMPEVYHREIEPHLSHHKVLDFASGYNIGFALIKPLSFVDVVMVAPRMIGRGVRQLYKEGKGFASFIGIEQNASGSAKNIVLALAKGIGSTRAGVMQLTMRQEAELDLFSEQAFGPAFGAALGAAISVELEAGYPPEAVLLELYMSGEMAMVMQAGVEVGMIKQMDFHSQTSQYGSMTRRPRFATGELKEKMRAVLEEIRSGKFSQEWTAEQKAGLPTFKQLKAKAKKSSLIALEERVRRELLGK
ncbi:MAG: ketol-acid reductoisomerase [Candidatus Tectomicrobia bacterium]|uniref:Ketol-acid reductoisomerase n=1 Tax=Tectimicrobiota bacterium TaxID=2528274 RepID=A0A933LRA1_UNCTE|nr:ketol-acid reductoisomerase [Candidatus Tectomicrobia bacterium]